MKHPDSERTALTALREEWGEGWHFFRARTFTDAPGDDPTGDFIATLTDRRWGIYRTLMKDTPADMRRELARQRAMAQAGHTALDISSMA